MKQQITKSGYHAITQSGGSCVICGKSQVVVDQEPELCFQHSYQFHLGKQVANLVQALRARPGQEPEAYPRKQVVCLFCEATTHNKNRICDRCLGTCAAGIELLTQQAQADAEPKTPRRITVPSIRQHKAEPLSPRFETHLIDLTNRLAGNQEQEHPRQMNLTDGQHEALQQLFQVLARLWGTAYQKGKRNGHAFIRGMAQGRFTIADIDRRLDE